MSRNGGANCTICTEFFSIYHMHHTVPRSRGGENSLQIPLCSSCHNILHANGVYVVARIRRAGKGKPNKAGKRFWKTPQEEANAAPWLKILVQALMTPIAEGYEAQHPIQMSFDTSLYEMVKLLKEDLGASSIEETIRHSIALALSERGLGNAARQRQAKRSAELWFMHSPSS